MTHQLIISAYEAGALIGLKRGTTKNYILSGRFPIPVRKVGRNWVCLLSDAVEYANHLFDRVQEEPATPAVVEMKRSSGRPRKVTPESTCLSKGVTS